MNITLGLHVDSLQWPTRKPRLLWPLCTSSLDFPFVNILIFAEQYISVGIKTLYSLCVRLNHLNNANKVEVEIDVEIQFPK